MRKWLISIIAVLLASSVSAQFIEPTKSLQRYAGNIHQFNGIFPQEKVYLQFDNTAYFSGETIWIKGYIACRIHLTINITNTFR